MARWRFATYACGRTLRRSREGTGLRLDRRPARRSALLVESYYMCELHKGINVSVDLQGVNHPGYNQDRGPVAILGVRVHFAY